MDIPKKAKYEIKNTKRVLKEYECTFIEYMESLARRVDIDLGDIVKMGDRDCIVCGWNGSANYE